MDTRAALHAKKRIDKRIRAAAARRARVDELRALVRHVTERRDELLQGTHTPAAAAIVWLDYAHVVATATAELLELGAMSIEQAENIAEATLNVCGSAVEKVIPNYGELRDGTFGYPLVADLINAFAQQAHDEGVPLIHMVAPVSAWLSWYVGIYEAISRFDSRKLRIFAIAAPLEAARYMARHFAGVIVPIHDRIVSKHIVQEAAKAELAERDRIRSHDVVRLYRRRGPPCRRTTSRIIRCAPLGAHAPPLCLAHRTEDSATERVHPPVQVPAGIRWVRVRAAQATT